MLENSLCKKGYECDKEKVKFLFRELMQYEPADVDAKDFAVFFADSIVVEGRLEAV